MVQVSTVILAHGAWSNSSVWTKVLPLLNDAGITSTAAQLPLTALAEDSAALTRAIALAEGPVLLVGHSYGGVVITQAGSSPKVTGLIYVAAFAPGAGESADSMAAGGAAYSPPRRDGRRQPRLPQANLKWCDSSVRARPFDRREGADPRYIRAHRVSGVE